MDPCNWNRAPIFSGADRSLHFVLFWYPPTRTSDQATSSRFSPKSRREKQRRRARPKTHLATMGPLPLSGRLHVAQQLHPRRRAAGIGYANRKQRELPVAAANGRHG